MVNDGDYPRTLGVIGNQGQIDTNIQFIDIDEFLFSSRGNSLPVELAE
jgi:hypothetical protein